MVDSVIFLAAEFPAHWHTYLLDEGDILRQRGMTVHYTTTRAPAADMRSEILARRAGRIDHLFPVSLADAAWFLWHPGALVRALGYVAGTRAGGLRGRLRRAALLPSVARAIRLARRRGAPHLHVHSFGDAAHVAAMAHRAAGLSYTLVLHGTLSVWGGDIEQKARGAARIFAVTRPLARDLSALCPAERIDFVTMGIDLDRFTVRDDRDRQAPFTLLSVGRLHLSKGHRFMARALARLAEKGHRPRWLIVGTGPHRAEIEAEIARLGLADQVSLLGARTSDEIAELLHRVDAFSLTSTGPGEAAPVSVMEAMASGVPVICSRIGGTADMIDSGVDGFLTEQEDVDGIAAALERLITDPAQRDRMARAARARAERDFDGRVLSGRIHDALRSI
ncbi:glycosyltransferase family 4 protein [Jhaorihella thermophila]|uniref:Glycosyltransferase involved in cell wall bisynthesis n=1 Tax=Jhaorihella thermophila TaxID=488547 RepID=A0A1H5RTQ2_9RHOB|nr:glycosyltransferase family 4 protein [Jhaorihella thermophila]SEF40891.1 Glycosyltransferase involved in cell wall bisynthesis [Jhaorihella thermophila]